MRRQNGLVERLEGRRLLAGAPGIVWSTYVAGDHGGGAAATTVDTAGNLYVAGYTREMMGTDSQGQPAPVNRQCVMKVSPRGELLWKAMLAERTTVRSVAVDASGNVYAVGVMSTVETNVSMWDDVVRPRKFTNVDGFFTKISPSGAVVNTIRIGGMLEEVATAVAVDSQGNAYVCGGTTGSGFYTGSSWSALVNSSGLERAYVLKVNGGTSIGWITMLDGRGVTENIWSGDDIRAITLDPTGNIYVVGSGYPVTGGGPDSGRYGGASVAKLSSSGAIIWSGRIGGEEWAPGRAIATDLIGNVYVAGTTSDSRWVSGGFDTSYGGGGDGFVARINANGTVGWSTYLGGDGADGVTSLAVDQAGNVYAGGGTDSLGWAAGGSDTTLDGNTDGFVAKITPQGTLAWSSYVGGSADDAVMALAVSRSGSLYAAGNTESPNWASGGFDTRYNGGDSVGFIAKFGQPAAPVVVTGTGSADRIEVTVAADQYVVTLNGSSRKYEQTEIASLTIHGLGGDDVITVAPDMPLGVAAYGDEGNDTISAGGGDCSLYGGTGNDSLIGGEGWDVIEGGEGEDTLSGGGGNDTLYGHDGADVLDGGAGQDELYGNAGKDTLRGGEGADVVFGQSGDDVLYGDAGDDTIRGELGADSLIGGTGNDSLFAGDQSDTIYGNEGDDYIEGKGKADTVYGGSGNDTIWGGAGADWIDAGEGQDWVDVGAHPLFVDSVYGGAGSDTVRADGEDLLDGVEVSVLG